MSRNKKDYIPTRYEDMQEYEDRIYRDDKFGARPKAFDNRHKQNGICVDKDDEESLRKSLKKWDKNFKRGFRKQ